MEGEQLNRRNARGGGEIVEPMISTQWFVLSLIHISEPTRPY